MPKRPDRKSRALPKFGCKMRVAYGCRGQGKRGRNRKPCKGGVNCPIFLRATKGLSENSDAWVRAVLMVGGFHPRSQWSVLNAEFAGKALPENWAVPRPEGGLEEVESDMPPLPSPKPRGTYRQTCSLGEDCPFYPWVGIRGCRGGEACKRACKKRALEEDARIRRAFDLAFAEAPAAPV